MAPPPRILLVDDDPQIRSLTVAILSKEFPDFRIEVITNRAQLDDALGTPAVGLVITDYQLGWTTGLAVLRAAKARCPDCPVIMFTSTGSEEIAVEAMKAGLDDYVLKSERHLVRLPAAVRQVLEQAEQRRKLRDVEARNQALATDVLDTSAVGIIILDANFTVVWINAALERFFGLRRAAVIGTDKRRLIRERIKHVMEHPDRFAQAVLATYERNDHIANFECHVLAGHGRDERWLEHRSLPIRTGAYAGGRIEHYYDITDRKRMEVQAGYTARLAALGQLVSAVAHQIRNPLFVLTGYLQLFQEKLGAQAAAQELESDVAKAREAARRIAEIIEGFVKLAAPASPRKEHCSIAGILREMLGLLAPELLANQIEVATALPPDLPPVEGDPRELQELFLNLLLNAAQAMAQAHGRGTLTVEAKMEGAMGTRGEGKGEGPWIEVRVQDDGPGIPPEQRARLFEPFFTTKPPGQGTGLGLWTVKRIAMSLGGAATCESEPGRGATFIVRLPAGER